VKLSIIIPAHNEQDNIVGVINELEHSLTDIDYELLVVNDHSTDATAELVDKLTRKYNNIKLVENKLDKGFANAIKTGFQSVNTELVIPVMGDLCDDLFTIKIMLEKINEGYYIVCGARYVKGGARLGGARIKGCLSAFAGRSLNCLLGVPTHDIANAFKMYRKKVIDSIEINSKGFEVSMEIPLKAHYLGFKITEVPTIWRERTKGKSNFKIFKLLPNYLKLYLWAIFKKFKG
jgi:glycosyltransferase involved in cell wall biosynthesis